MGVVGEKGSGMEGVGGHTVRSLPQALAVCLCRTAKVPPTGVGFCSEGDPWSGGSIRPVRGGPPGGPCPGSLPRPDRGTADEVEHSPAGEAGRSGHTGSGQDVPCDLDGVLCNHRTARRGTQGPSRISHCRSHGLS